MAIVLPEPASTALESNQQLRLKSHESRCGICSHPERQAIESAFQRCLMSVAEIGRRFGVGHDAVYRHAHATGLLKRGERRTAALVRASLASNGKPEQLLVSDVRPEEGDSALQLAKEILEDLSIPVSDAALETVVASIKNRMTGTEATVDQAANQVFVDAALAKISRTSDDWMTWFEQKS